VLSATVAGAISAGHARALVGLPTPEAQEQGLKVVLGRHLSVRGTERWVHDYAPAPPARKPEKIGRPAEEHPEPGDEALAEVARQLRERFGDAATIAGNRSRGQVTLRYDTAAELDDMLEFLLGR
jgi:ParB family transcriptional regulator, chromosome partitioning protein